MREMLSPRAAWALLGVLFALVAITLVELGGDLLLELDNPYGHDYSESGLERFYTRDGSVSERVREREVALEHFAYFPGSVVTAAIWRVLPEPFDDYRLLVLFCNLGMLAAAMAFRGPLGARLALGALLVCNPIAVRWAGPRPPPRALRGGAPPSTLFAGQPSPSPACSRRASFRSSSSTPSPFTRTQLRNGPGAIASSATACSES